MRSWDPLVRKLRRKFRRGHAPYLTRIRFYWCDKCNVPRFAETVCSVCGNMPREVSLTPPGDPFPAMDGHLKHIIDAVDRQFGSGVGERVFPMDKTIVMNKVPALDAMYEVIVDGYILGRLRFDIPNRKYTFVLSLEGGRRIAKFSKQKWVSCKDEVIPYLRKGANLLVPGISGCDPEILVGDEVWVVNSNGQVISVGIARMDGTSMAVASKGYAVKIREFGEAVQSQINPKSATWIDAVAANATDLDRIENEALKFIRIASKRFQLPIVVGFSGGKDSLVTYLLVEKALGYSPPIFFMDTGLELPETIEFVRKFAHSRNVSIIGQNSGEQFWKTLDTFGPPARDFRWCCKVLKLGPAATTISEKMHGNILAFMGQRRLESFQRSLEPRVNENPWVPGQISANPIRNWNALEVWLYTFKEGTPFNPLYAKGYHRLGCFLCPASSLAEIESLKDTHPFLYDRWMTQLFKWAEEHGYPKEWVLYGFWRWKHLPKGQLELARTIGFELEHERESRPQELTLHVVKGISPCVSAGYSMEGQFSTGLDIERVSKMMSIFGRTRISDQLGALWTKASDGSIVLFSSGSIVLRGSDASSIERLRNHLEHVIHRALFCQACGSCIPKCEQNALTIAEDGKIAVDPAKCTHCLACNSWPCPTYLS